MFSCPKVIALGIALITTANAAPTIETRVDLRVELFSIISRLADYAEYTDNGARSARYYNAIDEYFAPYKEHPAVRIAREIRVSHRIAYNAPVSLAVTLDDAYSLKERVDLGKSQVHFDSRWKPEIARPFLAAVREFVRDANFEKFVKAQRPFYEEIEKRLAAQVKSSVDLPWFDKYYRLPGGDRFIVVPGLISSVSYGPSVELPSGERELYAVVRILSTDEQGVPSYTSNDMFTQLLVHEFSHSYVNPYTARHELAFTDASQALFQSTEQQMRSITYGRPSIVLNESLIRAATCRYMLHHFGKPAADACVQQQQHSYFYWTPRLYSLFETYENNRAEYPSFEAFTNQIAECLKELSQAAPDLRSQYESSRPKIVSMSPANGVEGLAPGQSVIKLHFDQPMQGADSIQKQYAFIRSAAFEEDGKILALQVDLQPDTPYTFVMNAISSSGTRLRNRKGIYLGPYNIKLKTAAVTARTQ